MHLDPSVIYRCFNPAFCFSTRQAEVSVVHCTKIDELAFKPDIVVCHRPRSGKALEKVFARFSTSRLVADFDDLLFCFDSLETHPANLSGRSSNAGISKDAKRYFDAASRFNEFTVSTEPLKQRLLELFPDSSVHIFNNGWGADWQAFSSAIPEPDLAAKKICYFAGTANHDQDLFSISQQLCRFLEENPDIKFEVYGSIDLAIFASVQKQVIKGSAVPFYLFPTIIREAWVTVAPLIESPFNQCKSAIKFIESGLFGVPLIASPVHDFKRMKNDGLMFVEQKNQWYEELNRLLDPQVYEQKSLAAKVAANDLSAESALKNSNLLTAWNV